MVAVHQACQALRDGDCKYALAGGVNTVLDTEFTETMRSAGFLSPTGRCHSFDARADGYVRAEGCGLMVLTDLDHDDPYCELLGSAVNQDGKSNGLTSPNPVSQKKTIHHVLCEGRG